MGEPFVVLPSDDVLRQVVFEPRKVREKAWVVYINYLLLSTVTADVDKKAEAERFRHNTQLALNNSSIYLQPSVANIQALVLLAAHGEDYAAPNVSWMLLSHACRQAEVLSLHTPGHGNAEAYQQRLCRFWLLFVLDKSCSLTFGRPPFLSTAIYDSVPVPDYKYLLKFQPHRHGTFDSQQTSTRVSKFGAHLLIRSFELARLMGRVSDALAAHDSLAAKRQLLPRFVDWDQDAKVVCTHHPSLGDETCNH